MKTQVNTLKIPSFFKIRKLWADLFYFLLALGILWRDVVPNTCYLQAAQVDRDLHEERLTE